MSERTNPRRSKRQFEEKKKAMRQERAIKKRSNLGQAWKKVRSQ